MAQPAGTYPLDFFDRIGQIYKELSITSDLRDHNTVANPGTAQALMRILQFRDAIRTRIGQAFHAALERSVKAEARYKRSALLMTIVMVLILLLLMAVAILPMLPVKVTPADQSPSDSQSMREGGPGGAFLQHCEGYILLV